MATPKQTRTLPIGEGGPARIGRLLGISRQRVHQIMHREKNAARGQVAYALKTGKLIKPDSCIRCSVQTADLEGHHPDYSKPLEVMWLCTECHNEVHPHGPKVFLRPVKETQ